MQITWVLTWHEAQPRCWPRNFTFEISGAEGERKNPDFSEGFPKQLNVSLQAKLPFATACKANGVIWFVLNGGTGSYRIVKPLPNTTRSQLKHKISPSLSRAIGNGSPVCSLGKTAAYQCLNMLSGSTWFNKQRIPRELFQGKDAIIRPYSWENMTTHPKFFMPCSQLQGFVQTSSNNAKHPWTQHKYTVHPQRKVKNHQDINSSFHLQMYSFSTPWYLCKYTCKYSHTSLSPGFTLPLRWLPPHFRRPRCSRTAAERRWSWVKQWERSSNRAFKKSVVVWVY